MVSIALFTMTQKGALCEIEIRIYFEVRQMSSHFPKRLPEKLMANRERYVDLTAAEPSKSLDRDLWFEHRVN